MMMFLHNFPVYHHPLLDRVYPTLKDIFFRTQIWLNTKHSLAV